MQGPDLSIVVNGMKFENPFVLGSGPPGAHAHVMAKSFDLGWGGCVIKTISLDASKVINTAPCYAKLRSRETGEVVGFENIETLSARVTITSVEALRDPYTPICCVSVRRSCSTPPTATSVESLSPNAQPPHPTTPPQTIRNRVAIPIAVRAPSWHER